MPPAFAVAMLSAAFALIGLAGCSNDEEATLSPEQQIESIGSDWAPLFADDPDESCRLMSQPACERIKCQHIDKQPLKNCTPPSTGLRASFRDATVQDIAINGNRAGVRFSNGETVQFVHSPGFQEGGFWGIEKYWGDARRHLFR